MFRALKDKIKESMGLKFVSALTAVLMALMALGSIFVAQMLMEAEYRAIETRGKELGLFLGKASADHILFKNIIGIDTLSLEAVKSSEGMLYAIIFDASGEAPLSTVLASFNLKYPGIRAILAGEKMENVNLLMSKVNATLDPIRVTLDINIDDTKLGMVKMGFSRDRVQKNAMKTIGLLLGTSVVIVGLLAAMIFFMARKMIVAPTE